MVYSAALLALWLWLDLCGSSGAGCLLAVVSPLPSCWLWLFWRSASGFDLWAALHWCCLRVFVRVRFWGWRFVRSGAVWACPGVPVSSAAALLGLVLGDDAGQKDIDVLIRMQNAQFCKAVFV